MPWWHTATASKARISILKHSINSMARGATSAPSSAAFCCRQTSGAAGGQESGACDAGHGGVWSASTPTAFARPLSRSISASLQRISPISTWQSGLLHLPVPAVSCWSACVPCVVAWYCRQSTDTETNRKHVRTSHTHTHTVVFASGCVAIPAHVVSVGALENVPNHWFVAERTVGAHQM